MRVAAFGLGLGGLTALAVTALGLFDGLALFAVASCVLIGAVFAPLYLLAGTGQHSAAWLHLASALVQALLVTVGAWAVVGSPGDWDRVLRAVAATIAMCSAFAFVEVELGHVSRSLGQLGRRVWDPLVVVGATGVAVVAWYAIAVWLPLPVALAAAGLVSAPFALLHLRSYVTSFYRGGRPLAPTRDVTERPRRQRDPLVVRGVLSAASSTYAAWRELDDAIPPDWAVLEPRFERGSGLWTLLAFDRARISEILARAARLDPLELSRKADRIGDLRESAGEPVLEWRAAAPSEEGVIREMARCLRAIGEGRVPG